MRFPPYIWEVFFIDNEKNSIKFAIFPLEMLNNEKYNNLTAKDSVLYMLLLNRLNISKKNLKHFSDKNGVFVYYSNEQITKDIRCNKDTASIIPKRLESAGLIRREYQKRGLPLKIYVNDVFGVHTHTYNKKVPQSKAQDKPEPKHKNSFKSPAVYKEKETSFDINQTEEMANKHLMHFAEKKKKRKPN